MPIYEYKFEKCAYKFELIRRFNKDGGNPICPRCQGKVYRVYSPPAILFKGSGFYITDSRSDRGRTIEEGKTQKAADGVKGDGKADKVEGRNKSESK